jgi:hypothetical protein
MTVRAHRAFDAIRDQRGAILVEMALVALVLFALLAVTVEFGRVLFSAQLVQDTARVAARELALTPLPAAAQFDPDGDAQVKAALDRVLDRCRLVIDLAGDPDLDVVFAALPVANQMLRAAMIVDTPVVDGTPRRLLRYPGALLRAAPGACPPDVEFTVGIPRVDGRAADGTETITWVDVIEEIRPDPALPSTGPFSLAPTPESPEGQPRGVVAVRINYPYQAAMLSGFRTSAAGVAEPNADLRIKADDAGVVETSAPLRGTTLADDRAAPYAGPFGLGTQLAFAESLRPFRRLLVGQAVFRREVFE